MKHSDVAFQVGTEKFSAHHRGILEARTIPELAALKKTSRQTLPYKSEVSSHSHSEGMQFDEADMENLMADGTYQDIIVRHIVCESSTISAIALQALTTSLSHFRSSTKWDTW
jgi:hypothetical protein